MTERSDAMRIDAREPGFTGRWLVWHAEQCRELRYVAWVDDGSMCYGQYVHPFVLSGGAPVVETRQAKRIVIIPASRVVVINPVDDADEAGLLECISASVTARDQHARRPVLLDA
jgi:hypothetical protein